MAKVRPRGPSVYEVHILRDDYCKCALIFSHERAAYIVGNDYNQATFNPKCDFTTAI